MKARCNHCNKIVEFDIVEDLLEYEEDNLKILYKAKRTFCKECGKESICISDEIEEYNQESFEKAYKELVNNDY